MRQGADDAVAAVRPLWPALGILAAVCLVYLPAFSAGYVWDDDLHLLDNSVLGENGLYRVWVLRQEWIYYPVTFTSYWLEYQLWGFDPTGYHATNVLLHGLSALLFWRILRELRMGESVAILAALLFALHPQNVESVAWITQRKNVLSMLFFLVSVHAYLRFDALGDPRGRGRRRTPAGSARRRAAWYAGSLLAFTLGMLSKGSIAPQPFVLLLALLWRRGFGQPRAPEGADRDAEPASWRRPLGRGDWLALAVFLLPALGLPLHDILREQIWLGGDVVRDDSLAAKVAGAGWNAWFYAWKTLVPAGLSFVYPRWEIDPARILHWVPTVASLLGLAGALLWWRRGRAGASVARALAFAAAYYALMLSPALGFLDFYYLRYSYVADHYQYYAQLGLVALLAAGWVRLPWPGARSLAIASGLVLLALGGLTVQQCRAYHDPETLWRDTLAKNPDASLALNSLAGILGQRGENEEALSLLLRATEADPTNREAWLNTGLVQEALGRPEQALAAYREAVRHWPGSGGLSEREVEALSLVDAHVALGRLRMTVDSVDAAVYHFGRAAALAPDDARAKTGMGDTLLVRGQVGAAIASYQEALRLDPEQAQALEKLTRLYASYPLSTVRDGDRAVVLGERAAALTGREDPLVLDALAAAYAEAGRFDEAVSVSERAARLAKRSGQPRLAEEIDARRALYARSQPHRMESLRLRSPERAEKP